MMLCIFIEIDILISGFEWVEFGKMHACTQASLLMSQSVQQMCLHIKETSFNIYNGSINYTHTKNVQEKEYWRKRKTMEERYKRPEF